MAFVKLDKSIQDSFICRDSEILKIYIEMLFCASYKKCSVVYNGIRISLEPDQFVYGRETWAKKLNVSEYKMRTVIGKMISKNVIKLIKSESKYTIYEMNKSL